MFQQHLKMGTLSMGHLHCEKENLQNFCMGI